MQRILAAIGVLSLAALTTTATATASNHNPADEINICHATGSESNPYVPLTISLNGLNGHANANHQLSEDIIPPNDGDIVPEGMNWNADNQAFLERGCVPVTDTPEEPVENDTKITICHATGSATNPYVKITISLNGLNGHANANHQLSEDIIPPNDGDIVPAGQNWTTQGQATYNNDCVPVTQPEVPVENDKKITICHATGSATNPYVRITISLNGLNGHANANHQLSEDIIPPNDGDIVPAGQNWTTQGQAIYNNNCAPVTVTDTDNPPAPGGGAVVVPKPNPGGAVAGGAGVGAAKPTNQGYGVQTAVSETPAGTPWQAGLAALLAAGAVVAARRNMSGGTHAGR